MSKTDLRIIRTKKNVREAFLLIRKKTPLDKVKVTDICKGAMINTSTFYDHYSDIFSLSDELENELLAECFESFTEKDCLFTDTEKFLINIRKTIGMHENVLSILFSNRFDVMYKKLEKTLIQYYCILDFSLW